MNKETTVVTNQILLEDMAAIYDKLSPKELDKLRNSTILLRAVVVFLDIISCIFFRIMQMN